LARARVGITDAAKDTPLGLTRLRLIVIFCAAFDQYRIWQTEHLNAEAQISE
jgi:hypothetical protein